MNPSPRRRRATLAATAATSLVSLAALTGAALTGPAEAAPTAAAAPTVVAAAPDVPVANVQAHLQKLQDIATANGGNRRAGSAGYTASTSYVKSTLEAAGYTVTLQRCTTCTYPSDNVIADWPGGDASKTYVFGAHLDSVSAGPGINDNGSGSAILLENALQLAKANPTLTGHARFTWWTDEEQGLNGSAYYVKNLTSTQRGQIKAYYNFDMVASTNGGYFINHITTAAAAPMKTYWDSLGLQPEENVEGAGRSDDYSFENYGIPTSGYAMGASARKTSAQAAKWGGTSGSAYDPCYHSSCDKYPSNINVTGLDRSADGLAYTIWNTAVSGGSTPPAGGALTNGGFESGTTGWTGTSGPITNDTGRPAHSGSWKLWLGGNGSPTNESVSQSFAVPAGATNPTLTYWIRIDTAESGSTAYDKATVQINGTTKHSYSNASTPKATWSQRTIDLSAYQGTTVTLKFAATEDSSLQTSFVIDDVATSF